MLLGVLWRILNVAAHGEGYYEPLLQQNTWRTLVLSNEIVPYSLNRIITRNLSLMILSILTQPCARIQHPALDSFPDV